MLALVVCASKVPRDASPRMDPLEVRRDAFPVTSVISILAFDVVASRLPCSRDARRLPFDDFTTAAPCTSSTLTDPFELTMRSSSNRRGTRMVNRAPIWFRVPYGGTVLI